MSEHERQEQGQSVGSLHLGDVLLLMLKARKLATPRAGRQHSPHK